MSYQPLTSGAQSSSSVPEQSQRTTSAGGLSSAGASVIQRSAYDETARERSPRRTTATNNPFHNPFNSPHTASAPSPHAPPVHPSPHITNNMQFVPPVVHPGAMHHPGKGAGPLGHLQYMYAPMQGAAQPSPFLATKGGVPHGHAMHREGQYKTGVPIENTDPTKPQGIPGSLRCLIPEKSMRLIIGAGGANVKKIGSETGTFVNVSAAPFATADMCTDHIVSINPRIRMENYGTALSQCTCAMKQVMMLAFPNQDHSAVYKCIFLVHSNLAGLMIGKGGDRIAALRKDFNVQVQLAKPPDGQCDEEVTFSGKLDDVSQAVNILNDAFRVYYSDQPADEQQRQQIEAARRGENFHTCKDVVGGGPLANVAGGSTAGKVGSAGVVPVDVAAVVAGKNKGGGGKGYSPMGVGGGIVDLNAISVCPHLPLERQMLRTALIALPSGMDPAAFIGKAGVFMKELKAVCCRPGVGYIKRMHLEEDKDLSVKTGKSENRIDFQATEGVFPHACAQIFERFRIVERNMSYYQQRSETAKTNSDKNSEYGTPDLQKLEETNKAGEEVISNLSTKATANVPDAESAMD